jgi:hypothetical protein
VYVLPVSRSGEAIIGTLGEGDKSDILARRRRNSILWGSMPDSLSCLACRAGLTFFGKNVLNQPVVKNSHFAAHGGLLWCHNVVGPL